MSRQRLGLDADRFRRFRPRLDDVACLDLNWGHGFSDNPYNFGLTFLYSISNTGHQFVAACTIPGLAPERYPIALVDEGGYEVDVFASSISSWLPGFVLRTAERLRDAEVAGFLDEEPALRTALRGFGPAADRMLTEVVTCLRAGTPVRTTDLYAPIEPDGYVASYHARAAAGLPMKPLIDDYPWFNKPLYHRIGQPKPPARLAVEMFHRRLVHDAAPLFLTETLPGMARLATGHTGPELAPLVADLAEHGLDHPDFWVGEAFFEAGQRVEAADPDALPHALACYENAVHQHAAESEEPHTNAFARITALANRLGDEDYSYYLDDAFTYIPVE